jgi:hypothetical protein
MAVSESLAHVSNFMVEVNEGGRHWRRFVRIT